jgi:hypothetical protein
MINPVNNPIGLQVQLSSVVHFDSPLLLVAASSSFLGADKQSDLIQCIDGGDVAGGCRLKGSMLDETVANTLNGKDGLLIACCCFGRCLGGSLLFMPVLAFNVLAVWKSVATASHGVRPKPSSAAN